MKISVVIPTYNRRELLARTLATVFVQDFPPEEYEIVVVVDGSTDATAEFLRTLKTDRRMRVVTCPRNLGQAAARNSAIRIAQGDLILFVDDDLLCDRSLLKEHAAAHEEAESLVVSGHVLTASDSPSTLTTDRLAKVRRSYPVRVRGEISWQECNGAANISVPRALLLACGGFDEGLFRMSEDVDLVLRLHRMGASFYYQPGAIASQVYKKSHRQLVDDAAWAGRNLVILCRKQPDYRPYSGLATLGRGSWLKRQIRQLGARIPLSPEPLLELLFRAAERLRRVDSMRDFGVGVLEKRMALAAWRSALRQTESWDAMRREFGMRLPVLLYHHVGPPRTRTHSELTVSPPSFERHVSWLARRGYTGITASDWWQWCVEAKPLPSQPVLISFDDGYADLADYALPVLRRHGFSAVVYIITGKIGGEVAWDDPRSTESYKLMGVEQIRHWAREGIEFGAHSRTHADLTMLGADRLTDEIAGSKEDLERVTGVPALSFAYPFGYLDDTVVEAARNRFAMAMSCDDGFNDLATDPCLLRRTIVRPFDTVADIELRAALGWNPLENIRGFLRVRSRLRTTLKAARRLAQRIGAKP